MTQEIILKTKAYFNHAEFNADSADWNFLFTDKIWVSGGFWRLLKDNKIHLVSDDHGHRFGLPKPVDLVEELAKVLSGVELVEIKIKKYTGDLVLSFTDNIQLEVFITSSGYETYEFSIDDRRYIGMGSGEIAIFNLGQ